MQRATNPSHIINKSTMAVKDFLSILHMFFVPLLVTAPVSPISMSRSCCLGLPPFLLNICWVEHHVVSFHIAHHCSIPFTAVGPYLIHSVGTEDVRASPGHILGRCSDSSRPSKPCLPFAYGVSSYGRSSFWARHEGQIPRRQKANPESSTISQLVARGSGAGRRRVGGTGTTNGRQEKKRRAAT